MTTICQSHDHVSPHYAPDGLPDDVFSPYCTAPARLRITYFSEFAAQLLGAGQGRQELLVCAHHYAVERAELTRYPDVRDFRVQRLGLNVPQQAALAVLALAWVALGVAYPESVFAVWYRVIETLGAIGRYVGGLGVLLWDAVTYLF